MRGISIVLAGVLFLAGTTAVEAQNGMNGDMNGDMDELSFGAGFGVSQFPDVGGYAPFSASTLSEGIGRGLGNVIRSTGEATRNFSEAAINFEHARRLNMANHYDAIQARRQLERTYRANRLEEYREERAAYRRYRENIRETTTAPETGLSQNQWDPSTGEIQWPQALMAEEFAEYRKELQELFILKTNSRTAGELGEKIYSLALDLQNELRRRIRAIPAGEYVEAQEFVRALAQEGQRTAGGPYG